jgi:hypothetical protein
MPFQISKELERIVQQILRLKFREWVYILFKRGKPCIKTNGFIAKKFAVSRSARQGCPAASITGFSPFK